MDLLALMQPRPIVRQMQITTRIALLKVKPQPVETKEVGVSAKIKEDAKIKTATVRASSHAEKEKAEVVVVIATSLRLMKRKKRWAGKSASSPNRLPQPKTQNRQINRNSNTVITMSVVAKAEVSNEARHALNDIIATRTARYLKGNRKHKSNRTGELLATSLVNTSRKILDLITEIRESTTRLAITRKMKQAKMIQVVEEAAEEAVEGVVAAIEEVKASRTMLSKKKNISNKRKAVAVVGVEVVAAVEGAAKTMMVMVISSISMLQKAAVAVANSVAIMMATTTKDSHQLSTLSRAKATETTTKSQT